MHVVQSILVDGIARQYILHVPANVKPHPDLVIACHGGSSNGIEMWERQWIRQANKGFIIVCPTGNNPVSGSNWVALGDGKRAPGQLDEHQDERFLVALIAKLKETHQVDNVYMSGFSSGAKLTHHMYVTQRPLFAGFGMTGHGPTDEIVAAHDFHTGEAVSTRISFGTMDDNYDNPDIGLLDALDTMFCYQDWLSVDAKPVKTVFKGRRTVAKSLVFENPDQEISLQMVQLAGMQHRWAKVTKGDPYYEDDALIEFWQNYAGLKK